MKKLFKLIFSIFIAFAFSASVYAASGKISVSSSTSKIVVGKQFTVTIKVSSSSKIGTWEFTPSYDKNKFKLVKGDTPVVDFGDGKITSKTYKYTFKAIGTGSGKITVKSYGIIGWDKKTMSVSAGSSTVKVITQSELEASYSKDNYLKSLSVKGLKLSPTFNKNTTSYTVEANDNTTSVVISASKNDSKSSVSGAGTHKVSEGENKFVIVVTAQNGSTRKYTVVVNVIDPNPIKVNVLDKEYTIIKRESSMECPDGFEKTTITINDIKVPAFKNELNNFTLVGLRNSDESSLYIYDEVNNTYSPYYDVKLDELNIYPMDIENDFKSDYKKSEVSINDIKFDALLVSDNYYIIHAQNLNTGKIGYYLYDKVLNSITRYDDQGLGKAIEEIDNVKEKYGKVIMYLFGGIIFLLIVTLITLISKIKTSKKLKKVSLEKIEEIKKLKEVKEKEIKGKEVKEEKTNKKDKEDKKEVKKSKSKKKEV